MKLLPHLLACVAASYAGHAASATQDFDNPGLPYITSQYGDPPGPTVEAGGPTGNFLRLAPAVNSQGNVVAFDRPFTGAAALLEFDFSFRMGGGTISPGADGFSVGFARTATYGVTGALPPFTAEEPNLTGMLAIGFDTWDNGGITDLTGGNHVSLHWAGNKLSELDVTSILTLDDNVWHLASIDVDFFAATVALTIDGNPVFNEPVAGLTPFESRPVLAARTGGSNNNHDVDNILITVRDVPEPHEYALLAGLGIVGFAAWRRARR